MSMRILPDALSISGIDLILSSYYAQAHKGNAPARMHKDCKIVLTSLPTW